MSKDGISMRSPRTFKSKDMTTVVHVESGRLAVLVRSPPSLVPRGTMSKFTLTGGMSVNTQQTSGIPGGNNENLFLMQFELPKRTKKQFNEGDGLVMRLIGSILNERIQKFVVMSTSQVKKGAVPETIGMLIRLMQMESLKQLCKGMENELKQYMPFE